MRHQVMRAIWSSLCIAFFVVGTVTDDIDLLYLGLAANGMGLLHEIAGAVEA